MANRKVRVDQWLWAIRVFKTRAISCEECRKGKVLIDGRKVKPSYGVSEGEEVTVKQKGFEYRYKVLEATCKRVGAKIVDKYREDLTPNEEIERKELVRRMYAPRRERGAGRPTKKDRREIDKLRKKES